MYDKVNAERYTIRGGPKSMAKIWDLFLRKTKVLMMVLNFYLKVSARKLP